MARKVRAVQVGYKEGSMILGGQIFGTVRNALRSATRSKKAGAKPFLFDPRALPYRSGTKTRYIP
jgi:hypothetical protein